MAAKKRKGKSVTDWSTIGKRKRANYTEEKAKEMRKKNALAQERRRTKEKQVASIINCLK